jgi:hypothetical protein
MCQTNTVDAKSQDAEKKEDVHVFEKRPLETSNTFPQQEAMANPVIGQKALVKGSSQKPFLGMVIEWNDNFPFRSITVEHPVTKVRCKYDPQNVRLLPLA